MKAPEKNLGLIIFEYGKIFYESIKKKTSKIRRVMNLTKKKNLKLL